MHEIVVNLHMHTRYSDGTVSHADIAEAAIRCGLDAVIITDHNIKIEGLERYARQNGRRVLMLLGEEIHDRGRLPQKNHLLVLGADQELAGYGEDVEALLAASKRAGGLSFLAHPVDPALPAFGEADISWENWSIRGFTGLELWNGLSELKALVRTRMHGIFYAFFPAFLARGPLPATLSRWDELLRHGPVVAIGGSDAHALHLRLGPLRRTVFRYDYHFRAVNTHVLMEEPLTGRVEKDAKSLYAALAAGQCFIGYDLPGPTRGFRFAAHGANAQATIGGQIAARGGVALHARAPDFCELRLVKDGQATKVIKHGQALTHLALERGTYRIEAYRRFLGRRRAWIFSNPIYLR